jgi:hypothetical protein
MAAQDRNRTGILMVFSFQIGGESKTKPAAPGLSRGAAAGCSQGRWPLENVRIDPQTPKGWQEHFG